MSDFDIENKCDENCQEEIEKFRGLKKLINEIPTEDNLQEMSDILKALSDPLRLKIIYLLQNEELCGCHIDFILDKPQSTISHHLTLLKKSNLINWRKEGKWTYFSLVNPKLLEEIEKITEIVEE
jgi:ArsR family transcriptional regulator